MNTLNKEDYKEINSMYNKTYDSVATMTRVKVLRKLNLSVPVAVDYSYKNIAKRIIHYANPDMESEVRGKWLRMLVKRVKRFMNINSLEMTENLVKTIAMAKTDKIMHDSRILKGTAELQRGITCFFKGEFPEEDVMTWKDYLMNTIVAIFRFIDGRFGNRVLKPKYRVVWRFLTYGTIAILFFRLVICLFFEWWDGVVAWLNYVIWG